MVPPHIVVWLPVVPNVCVCMFSAVMNMCAPNWCHETFECMDGVYIYIYICCVQLQDQGHNKGSEFQFMFVCEIYVLCSDLWNHLWPDLVQWCITIIINICKPLCVQKDRVASFKFNITMNALLKCDCFYCILLIAATFATKLSLMIH